MLVTQIIYDIQTGETKETQIEVNDVPQEPSVSGLPTTDERLKKLENTDIDLIATNWEMDDRLLEVEWFLADNFPAAQNINLNLKGVGNMAGLSKFEQAKILILAGEYNREVMEKQLRKYESRGIITKDELDVLISMMNANELVQGQ